MRYSREVLDTNAKLGREVMTYLGQIHAESKKKKATHKPDNTLTGNGRLYDWKLRGSESDDTPAPKTSTIDEPQLRVSPLLSKQAGSDDRSSAVEGVDFNYDDEGYRVPVETPLSKTTYNWNKAMGSPILSSLAFGALPAALYWAGHKFLNPDAEGTEGQNIEIAAGKLIEEDEKAGRPLQTREYYIEKAIENQKKSRIRQALGIGLASSVLFHLPHINPSDWSQLWRYPKTIHDQGGAPLKKQSSMLGPTNAMSFNALKSAIAFNPNLTPSIKESALNALNFNPAPVMTSTNIINNAIYSGESAKTGLPIGRIITSAAVDGFAGYGLGKLLGVGSPKRLGLLTGIGSALYNAVSYNSNNN